MRRIERGHDFHRRLHDFTEAIEHAITAIILVGLGAAIPILFQDLTVVHVVIGVLLIFVVRPAAGWVSLAGTNLHGRNRAVVAIYGVRGVGSVYYLAYAQSHIEFVNEPQLWALVAFVILLSTMVHGLTAGMAMERIGPDGDEG